MTQTQHRELAIALAGVFADLQNITSPVAGDLGFPHQTTEDPQLQKPHSDGKRCLKDKVAMLLTKNNSLGTLIYDREGNEAEDPYFGDGADLRVLHFDKKPMIYGERDPDNGKVNTIKNNFGSEILSRIQFQFGRNIMIALEHCNTDVIRATYLCCLMQMAKEMDDLTCFYDTTYVFFHDDLEARNIMVSIDDSGSLKITGILDRDSARFVPQFVACAAPRFLWCDELGNCATGKEYKGHEEPEDPDHIEIKQLFDKHVAGRFA